MRKRWEQLRGYRLYVSFAGVAILLAGLYGTSLLRMSSWASPSVTMTPREQAQLASRTPRVPDATLQRLVEAYASADDGKYCVIVHNLTTGQYAAHEPNRVMPSASLYKLGVMYTVFADVRDGTLSLDEPLTVTTQTIRHEGKPTMAVGDAITVREAVKRMITWSDNTSAFLLLDHLGWDHVNETIQDAGMTHTQLGPPMATTRASDIALLLEAIATDRAIDPEASARMRELLLSQLKDDRLPANLPRTVPVAHKTGELEDMRHDAGIVYSPRGAYVVVVMAEDLSSPAAGADRIARLSSAVYEYFTTGAVVYPGSGAISQEARPGAGRSGPR